MEDSLQPFSGSVILLESGIPVVELRKGEGINKDSRFVMASLSKQITATLILQAVDAGKLDEIERRLGILSRNRTVSLDIIAKGGAGWMVPIDGKKAKGGPVDAGKTYLVGEQGQELFVPKQSGTIVPNNELGGIAASAASGSAPMVVNITTGADPEDVVRAIEKFKRRNGSLPF